MKKAKLARKLGISRPTLDKRLKEGNIKDIVDVDIETMKLCIKIQALHPSVNPQNMESILEFLSDMKFLSNEGRVFASQHWYLFIKQ